MCETRDLWNMWDCLYDISAHKFHEDFMAEELFTQTMTAVTCSGVPIIIAILYLFTYIRLLITGYSPSLSQYPSRKSHEIPILVWSHVHKLTSGSSQGAIRSISYYRLNHHQYIHSIWSGKPFGATITKYWQPFQVPSGNLISSLSENGYRSRGFFPSNEPGDHGPPILHFYVTMGLDP